MKRRAFFKEILKKKLSVVKEYLLEQNENDNELTNTSDNVYGGNSKNVSRNFSLLKKVECSFNEMKVNEDINNAEISLAIGIGKQIYESPKKSILGHMETKRKISSRFSQKEYEEMGELVI